ncbi:flagellar hook-length control protein FliK [Sphingomonas sp.]|uniref:flagellar hook-length control protein FliK n=1 Tax=Sphingomonas sp. TaxID=28214 RepID=UPI002ED8B787
MPDLLASASLLPLTPAIPVRTASVDMPAVADFMAMLGELLLPPGAKLQGGKGQTIAGDGKNLPVEGGIAGEDQDAGDAVIAWLPAGLVPMPGEPVALPDAASVVAPATAPEAIAPLTEAMPVQLDAVPLVETPPAAPADAVPLVAADVEGAPVELPPVAIEPELKPEAPVRERLARALLAPIAAPQTIVPNAPATQTAGQVFAAAISASFDSIAAPAARTADPVAVQAQASATEQLRTMVQAMAGADQAPLDLSRDDWTGKMVDRIATLREAAEAADTRIRLAPENLGNVDVSIRRDGDRLHVHFTAENPAARQLLTEAAPRLAELAEARGVKLGQTSVDAGAGGQSQGQSSQPQSHQPGRPASVAARTTQSDRDDRVA